MVTCRPRTDLDAIVERLKDRLHIAVVFGGNRNTAGAVIFPTRNPRSDKTYEAVATNIADSLRRLGFRHVALLPEDMLLGERLKQHGTHLAWLNTGGTQGYVSVCHAPAMLELTGIPYVGHNPLNAAILDCKHVFKYMLDGLAIPTPRYLVWNHPGDRGDPRTTQRFAAVFGGYAGKFIVKPVSGRASLHVKLVDCAADLGDAVAAVTRATENHVLIEQYLPGREFTLAVAGPVIARQRALCSHDRPFAFSPLERLLDHDEPIVTSMDVRPITLDRVRVLDAADDAAVVQAMTDLGTRIFRELGLETAVRVDMRADGDGRIHVLEANPKPDLKLPEGNQLSLICAGLAQQGMDYDDLILSLLANRLRFLLKHRAATIGHIAALLH